MDKELKNLLDNYEKVIYGQAFPIDPSMHQLHLLLDYIANLEQQVKKQKEVIDKAIEWVEKNRYYFPTPDELLDILKEVSNKYARLLDKVEGDE
jgi:hypothetical protein